MHARLKSASTSSLHAPGIPYQPPLTPVSEGDDTAETPVADTATISSTTSGSTSDRSYFHSRPLNFSRPRPVDFSPAHKVHHDHSDSSSSISISGNSITRVHSKGGSDSYKEVTALPQAPHFTFGPFEQGSPSIESNGLNDDYNWDEHLKDIKPAQRSFQYDAQRVVPSVLNPAINIIPQRSPIELAGSEPEARPHPADQPRPQQKSPSHTRVDSGGTEDWEGEDARSHHTASDDDGHTKEAKRKDENWRSSDFDISSLSEAEVKKLRKKGINPALYAEMKAARKGKGKWINPLAGNTFLS